MGEIAHDRNVSDDRYEPEMSVAEFKRRLRASAPVQVVTNRFVGGKIFTNAGPPDLTAGPPGPIFDDDESLISLNV